MACRNPHKGLMCEPPAVQRIDFYQGIDVPLATFLAATGPNFEAPKRCAHPGCGGGSSCCSSSSCWRHLCPQAQSTPSLWRQAKRNAHRASYAGSEKLGPQGCNAQFYGNQWTEGQEDQQQNEML